LFRRIWNLFRPAWISFRKIWISFIACMSASAEVDHVEVGEEPRRFDRIAERSNLHECAHGGPAHSRENLSLC
jgi:hypothetical protein